jgi:hypothetical protein
MRNSAVHPRSSTAVATSHTPFQELSWLLSLENAMSRFTPSGFTQNAKPVRRSWYESMKTPI